MQDILKCKGPDQNLNILAQPVNSGNDNDQLVYSGYANWFTAGPTGLQWGDRLKKGIEY